MQRNQKVSGMKTISFDDCKKYLFDAKSKNIYRLLLCLEITSTKSIQPKSIWLP